MSGNLESSGIKSGSIADNLSVYLLAVGSVLLLLIILYVVMKVAKKYKEKIKEKLLEQKKKFIYNGLIRSLSLSYLSTCIAVYANIYAMRE